MPTRIRRYRVYRSNRVTVSGLPDGFRLRLDDGHQAESVDGVARLDLAARHCPLERVSVVDAAGATVAELAPPDGVWGGDLYELRADP